MNLKDWAEILGKDGVPDVDLRTVHGVSLHDFHEAYVTHGWVSWAPDGTVRMKWQEV